MTPNDITMLHFELSSKCNAWCPGCSRNMQGYGLRPGLVETDLPIERFEDIIKSFPNLYRVVLCGNYGDPIATKNFLDYITIAKNYASKIQIHTNGSLRSTSWWRELAGLLSDIDHDVWFALDGIGATHEIYRQGTSYDKIIENATAFIENGGYATWQFIPFEHNEHQTIDCLKTSKKLKFKTFKVIKLHRKITEARHYQTNEKFELRPPKDLGNIVYFKDSRVKTVREDQCMHMDPEPSLYISAQGKISRCCYRGAAFESYSSIDEIFAETDFKFDDFCIDRCGSYK